MKDNDSYGPNTKVFVFPLELKGEIEEISGFSLIYPLDHEFVEQNPISAIQDTVIQAAYNPPHPDALSSANELADVREEDYIFGDYFDIRYMRVCAVRGVHNDEWNYCLGGPLRPQDFISMYSREEKKVAPQDYVVIYTFKKWKHDLKELLHYYGKEFRNQKKGKRE
jgi:hypothetical protein